MDAIMTHFRALIFIASGLGGCASPGPEPYRPVPLTESADPLAPRKGFPAWKPPLQFAVFVHPHEDRERRMMVGGHWMMLLLSEGSWYTQETVEHEPVPDGEAKENDVLAGLEALSQPGDAVVPFRQKGD